MKKFVKLISTTVNDLPCGGISVIYHTTEIFRIEGCILTLRHGEWKTVSIRRRINYFLRECNTGYMVFQRAYQQWVRTPSGSDVSFLDGITFRLERGLP